jgi:hypothetical protein
VNRLLSVFGPEIMMRFVLLLSACGQRPEATVLDFMQPQVAGGQLVGLCGKARRDEPGREGTLQHVG